jgi:hypothetical protein
MISNEELKNMIHMKKGSKVRYARDEQHMAELEEQGYSKHIATTINTTNSEEKTGTSGWNPKVVTTEEVIKGNNDKEKKSKPTKPNLKGETNG